MLGENLVKLRKSKRLGQEAVAEKIDVARTTYAMYEQNRRQPDYETLKKLAHSFSVSTDYLLDFKNKYNDKVDMKKLLEQGDIL